MDGFLEHVLFADEHVLVLDKPAGLLCVPGRGAEKQDCLASRVQSLFADALVVHRLDMGTSGLCVMARGADVQRQLSRAFAEREIDKRYIAVVAGRPLSQPGDGWSLIDLPIAADWPNRPLRVIDTAKGKPSRTRWRVVATPDSDARWGSGSTRLELEPMTGRTHQLRVHLRSIGHPILGDALYAPAEVVERAPRLLLHASELRFTHPVTGESCAFASPAPF
jgi:tRNA pseudouridine32 synthase/23S rRNA pseudouridine746 synthase